MSSSAVMPTRGLRVICFILVMLGLLGTGYALEHRVNAERSAKAVDIVLNYSEVESLSDMQGVTVDAALAQLREAGATAVALPEDTLNSLQDQGAVRIDTDGDLTGFSPQLVQTHDADNPHLVIHAANAEIAQQIRNGLARVYAPQNIANRGASDILVNGTQSFVGNLGVGLSPAKVRHILQAGLRIVPRLRENAWMTPAELDSSLAAVASAIPLSPAAHSRATVIFDGETIPGYHDLIPQLADALTKRQLVYGSIEFGKQKGDDELGRALDGHLVRVHSVSLEELTTLTPGQIVQRFGLAVKDRNIRVLYVHLPSLAVEQPLTDNAAYVKRIADEIRGEGFLVDHANPAHPFNPLSTPWPVLALIFAGAGGGLLLWKMTVLPEEMPRWYVRLAYAILAIGLIGALGAAFKAPGPGRILFGLLAATGYPLLAMTYAYRVVDRLVAERPVKIILPAIGTLLTATATTLCGALLIAAMMSETRFLVKIGQFAGVKLALAAPLVIFGLLIVTDGIARAGESFPAYLARCRERLQAFFNQPLYLWGIFAGIIGLVVLALVLARSGNDSGMTAGSGEMRMRVILDRLMVARPRTKEFVFGHPLFMLGIMAAARGQRVWALLLLLCGAIGQADVLNTYCHAHTPVLLSLLRTFNGLWLGVLIGLVVMVAFGRILFRPAAETPERATAR